MSDQPDIFSTGMIYKQFLHPPVVVVGLPRSGSSFLSRVLSCTPDLYVFDDLYIRQACNKFSNPAKLTDEDLHILGDRIYWILHSRIKFSPDSIPSLSIDEAKLLSRSIVASFLGTEPSWALIHSELLSRLAALKSSPRWGWKCPGDFRVLTELNACFPDIKVVFLHRHPYDVLLSRKFVRKGDGDPRTFHPVIQSLYWASASKHVAEFQANHPSQVFSVSFDDLTTKPNYHKEILSFLDAKPLDHTLVSPNSSFENKEKPKLTLIETYCYNSLCRHQMKRLGYLPKHEHDSIGILNFIATSIHFCTYYTQQSIASKASRATAKEFLRSLFKPKSTA